MVLVITYFILGVTSASLYLKTLWVNRAGWNLHGIVRWVIACSLLPIIICLPIIMFDEIIVRKHLIGLHFSLRAFVQTVASLIFILTFFTVTQLVLKSNVVFEKELFKALLVVMPFLYAYDFWSERKKDLRSRDTHT